MRAAGVREARQDLTALLEDVRRGREVTITDRGRPVARLVTVTPRRPFPDLAAVRRRNPFHPFSSFDTATLGGASFGQTVLSRAIGAAGLEWDPNAAHSAIYHAERTAALFCIICNKFRSLYEDACERAPQLTQREPPAADEGTA